MKTVKIKFVGKWQGMNPEDNLVYFWLKKHGYNVQITDDADYVICDVFGDPLYEYCNYPQIRIFECGENFIPDFNVVDYAISRYPVVLGDRNFYLPGCTNPGAHWYALARKSRDYAESILQEKPYFANLITSHDSEYQYRSIFFEKLNAYKRVESPGRFMNNMSDGECVRWLDDSKSDFQKKCKFTVCFESTSHYGFITEKLTDAFYADTIPIYFGSSNITDFFNKDAFINVADYESLDDVVEKIKELDQDDQKYIEMLRQPILTDNSWPDRIDTELGEFIKHIFEQPYDKAYRRSRVYYPKEHNDYLAKAIQPTKGYQLKQFVKKNILKKK